MQKTVLIFIFCLLFLNLSVAFAAQNAPEISWYPSGILINDTKGNSLQKNPQVVADGMGGHIIVWEDARSGYLDIYAQRVNRAGSRLWRSAGIPICTAKGNQMKPMLVADGRGGAIIVWQDYRRNNFDIYAQRIDFTGRISWQTNGVAVCGHPTGQFAPNLSADGEGGAYVFWHDYRKHLGEDIYAQRINKYGKSLWQENGVVVAGGKDTEWYPTSKLIEPNLVAVAWVKKFKGFKTKVYVQALNQDGKGLWGEGILVSEKKANQLSPSLDRGAQGNLLVAFEEGRGSNNNIVLQKISPAGKILFGNQGKTIARSRADQKFPKVCAVPSGIMAFWQEVGKKSSNLSFMKLSYAGENQLWTSKTIINSELLQENYVLGKIGSNVAVAWQLSKEQGKNGNGASEKFGVYAQLLSEKGVPLWQPRGIKVAKTTALQKNPTLAGFSDDGVLVVWQDSRKGNFDIFAQGFNVGGQRQFGVGGAMVNNSLGSVPQQNANLVEDGTGNFVVIWEDARAGYFSLFAQKMDKYGNLLWRKDGIEICKVVSAKKSASVVSLGGGEMAVAWVDGRDRNNSKVYVQKLNAYGEKLWDKNGVLVSDENSRQTSPVLAADGFGGVIVSFVNYAGSGSRKDIFAQRIDVDGKRKWKRQRTRVCLAPADQDRPVIISDRDGDAVIAWVDYRNGVRNPDIFSQKVDSSGSVLWEIDGVAVCRAPGVQKDPMMVTDMQGGAVIAWSDNGGGNYDIYSQRVNSNGKPFWKNDGVLVCGQRGTQREPKILSDGFSGAIVVWEDHRYDSWDVFAQRIDEFGVAMWNKRAVPICVARGTQYAPSLAADGMGGYLVTWEDYRSSRSYEIFAQKVDNGGVQAWTNNGILISKTTGGARNPQIATDLGGNAYIITWDDYRYGGRGIYAQRIEFKAMP